MNALQFLIFVTPMRNAQITMGPTLAVVVLVSVVTERIAQILMNARLASILAMQMQTVLIPLDLTLAVVEVVSVMDDPPVEVTTPKSCNEQKKVFPASSSGTYTIDPDGQYGKAHFNVHCNMTDKGGVGVTVVSHNSEARTRVNNCPSDPSCTRSVTYYWASFTQLAKLTQISAHCEQYIEYNCTGDVAFIGEQSAWWVSRDGVKQYYWGGATPGSKKCACGMTNTCHNGKGCNCHNSAGGWRRDRGLLTDKTTLPVKEMRFGDTDDSNEDAFYKLGKLKCY
ncbi:Contactin-associated protein 1 [Exaiptasia diaphana]|nr:Contactin-associated protein 1 [Exaiptasia diaphana]